MRGTALRGAGLTIGCGVLWGAAVTAMETLSQPTGVLPLNALLIMAGAIGWSWLVNGICWALAALFVRDMPLRVQLLSIVPIALAITLVHLTTWQLGLTIGLIVGGTTLIGNSVSPEDLFFHMLWMNLFYGGLYLLGFAGAHRARQSRQLLADIASSRAMSDAHRQQTQLRALRRQIQPGILIDALDALTHDYAQDSPRADPLFEELVRFLRAAMPAIRVGHATLGSELAMLETYAALRCQLGFGGGATIDAIDDADAALAFPPLCLLPLVDALNDGVTTDRPIAIHARSEHGSILLNIDIPADPAGLSTPDRQRVGRRLQLELAALHGAAATLSLTRRAVSNHLVIRLPAAAKETKPCIEACR